MFTDLPPVGDAIVCHEKGTLPKFVGFHSQFVDSGTSALALACLIANTLSDVSAPEIIIPAYGCPDLASAALYAKCKIVLVDVCSKYDASYDLDALTESVTENTVAVLGVSLLGVRERLAEIKSVLPEGVLFIEDNAQWCLELNEQHALVGDMSISSFGRGKPASVLGGGLLLISDEINGRLQEKDSTFFEKEINKNDISRSVLKRIKISVYNYLLCPAIYFWLSRNPWLKIGETVFHPLDSIKKMDDFSYKILPENFKRFTQRSMQQQHRIDQYVQSSINYSSIGLSADESNKQRRARLLRYPLLCHDEKIATLTMAALYKKGLGATRMYQKPLDEILKATPDVQFTVRRDLKNAKGFASRLITLPLHEGVTDKYLDEIINTLETIDSLRVEGVS